jgi:formylglycine-generating enzyme required for sulfatase activity
VLATGNFKGSFVSMKIPMPRANLGPSDLREHLSSDTPTRDRSMPRQGRVVACCAAAIGLGAMLVASQAHADCPADLTNDGSIDAADLSIVLVRWNATGKAAGDADLDLDGIVGASDISLLLAAWGTCTEVPSWATLVEALPDPAVIVDPSIREAIRATGYAWRVRDTATQVEMLLVPPGTFDMGCPATHTDCYADEFPLHAVTLTANFYMSRHEVTQANWVGVMGSNPSFFQDPTYPNAMQRPVEWVSWNDIQSFLGLTGFSLPTEAQWEYAYRAGTSTRYHGSVAQPNGSDDSAILDSIAWFEGNHGAPGTPSYGTKAVGLKAANGFGLHDMSGNVWEWVRDYYDGSYYSYSPALDPMGPLSGFLRLVRGGGCGYNPDSCRGSARGEIQAGFRHGMIGFRVVRTLDS